MARPKKVNETLQEALQRQVEESREKELARRNVPGGKDILPPPPVLKVGT
jgi:hypothetical protein